ncbi:hypothetical protein EC968_002563, partial [Mortierella alpina]
NQLATELKSHFSRGCQDIIKKLEIKVKKGLLAPDQLELNDNEPTILNFARLNGLLENPRKVLPVSTSAPAFVSFSERELLPLLWKSNVIKAKLVEMSGRPDMNLKFMEWWLSDQEPGRLTSELLTTVGRGRSEGGNQQGYQRSTKIWSFTDVRAHLETLRSDGFDPAQYNKSGYVLRGGISTNGFLIHVQAHKVKELQRVRYRKIAIPSRLTSTLGGTDDFLQEVRHVIRTPEDVARLWPCDPRDIKIVGIDPGQACVFGASALLPSSGLAHPSQHIDKEKTLADTALESAPANRAIDPATSATVSSSFGINSATALTPYRFAVAIATSGGVSSVPPSDAPILASKTASSSSKEAVVYHNMSVKSKAIYQPIFKFRKWLNDGKNDQPEGEQSIQDIESNMPAMRGADANFDELTEYINKHQSQLHAFYGRRYQKHAWDSRRAMEAEYAAAADQLLKMVGGSIGEKRKPDSNVLFGIGLGKFSSSSGLTSLHSSFETYLIKLLRSLGYVVVGCNEFYTSKKCPDCENFVCEVQIRILYCENCRTYFHRDQLAGNNIANVLQSYVLRQERPKYLQPVDAKGSLIWKTGTVTGTSTNTGTGTGTSSCSGSGSVSGSNSNSRTPARRKRCTQ